jgi:secreted trypsin-like serine protease
MHEQAKIVGGELVDLPSALAKSVVMLTVDAPAGGAFICTGTFIAENLVLTAAHCVNEDPTRMGMLYGANPLSGQFQSLNITKVYRHNQALKDGAEERNDLALVQFSGGLPEGAVTTLLPESRPTRTADETMTALGYGQVHGIQTEDIADLKGSGELRQVQLADPQFSLRNTSFTISQGSGKGVCFGDSGGPALIETSSKDLMIVGVASGVFSDQNVDEEIPGFNHCTQRSIYMNVEAYLGWIKDIQAKVNSQK